VNSDFNGGAQNWPADKTQPAVSTTYKGVTDLIDGGAEPFFAGSFTPTTFLWQNYINTNLSAADSANAPGGYTLSLYLLQMPSATQASGLYASVLAPGSTFTLYTSNTWDALSPVIGDESRIADSGADWQINFHKGAYYVQVDLNPSYDSAGNPNAQSKAETIKFATYIASKM
jgi:hypothetical protein